MKIKKIKNKKDKNKKPFLCCYCCKKNKKFYVTHFF